MVENFLPSHFYYLRLERVIFRFDKMFGEREREKKKEKELINSVGSMKVEGSLTYKLEGGKCVGQ